MAKIDWKKVQKKYEEIKKREIEKPINKDAKLEMKARYTAHGKDYSVTEVAVFDSGSHAEIFGDDGNSYTFYKQTTNFYKEA